MSRNLSLDHSMGQEAKRGLSKGAEYLEKTLKVFDRFSQG
jgi:hypothetical protein